LEQEIKVKTNIPCYIVTKKGMKISKTRIVSVDENKIKLDDFDRTVIEISDILSIEYMDEHLAFLEDQKKKEYSTRVQRNKVKQEVASLWKWILIILVSVVAVIIIVMNMRVEDGPDQNLDKVVNEKYEQIIEGMTIEEVNQLMGFDGELQGESTENGIHYETYKWDFAETGNFYYSVSCDFENGKAAVSLVQDSKGMRNSLGDTVDFK
jgi:hypothetical protein